MSETTVSYTDLSRVVSAINAVQATVGVIAVRTDNLQNQVAVVDNKVNMVNRDLAILQNEFRLFVKEQRNANNLQRAITEIVRVRQELEQKYGKHAEARKRIRGILDTADTGLLREFTIASCSEQIMLDTPKYWLSPCLVALAAWISNDKALTDRAIKVALERDVEKSTLLFALVSRRTVPDGTDLDMASVRAARQAACFTWLDCYFKCQNPLEMKESVIVLIDSWANNIFGEDDGNTCAQTFDNWMDTIRNSDPNFKDEQVAHWYKYYTYYNSSTKKANEVLSIVSPEFEAADEYLQRINAAPNIQHFFDTILATQINKEDLIDRLDEQLESLICEFDPEEEGLRKEETHYELVKKFEGDKDLVEREELRRAKRDMSAKVSLAQRLEDVVRSKDSKYAAARKTALNEKFLGKYVKEAYSKYITDKKSTFPTSISLRHAQWKGWEGRTADGNNGDALILSFDEHMNRNRQADLMAVRTGKRTTAIILTAVFALLSIILFAAAGAAGVVGLVPAVIFFIRIFTTNNQIKNAKANINKQYDEWIGTGKQAITIALKQWRAILQKVREFQSIASNEILDLTEKAIVADAIGDFVAPDFDDIEEAAPAEEAPADEDADDEAMGIDGLADLAGDSDADDLVDVVEEADDKVTMNQSPEFLKQFARQFSTEYVLERPEGVNFAQLKALQDSKRARA